MPVMQEEALAMEVMAEKVVIITDKPVPGATVMVVFQLLISRWAQVAEVPAGQVVVVLVAPEAVAYH